MRRRWLGKIALVVCSLAITICNAMPLMAAMPTLELNDPTHPPYTTEAGDGILDILVGEAVRRCGYQLKLVRLPAERGLINANEGLEDGDLSRIAGLEKNYPNLIRVPEKIFDLDFVVLTRQAGLRTAHWRDLESLHVGYIKGWKLFEKNITPKTDSIQSTTPEHMMELLRLGRIDAALYSRWMGLALARQLEMDDVRVAEPPLATSEMFIYLHKRHEELVPRLAEALRALKQDGSYQRVHDEQLAPYRDRPAP